jgi:hypothetical protein
VIHASAGGFVGHDTLMKRGQGDAVNVVRRVQRAAVILAEILAVGKQEIGS